jgi:beta-glucanase (GH16 family)
MRFGVVERFIAFSAVVAVLGAAAAAGAPVGAATSAGEHNCGRTIHKKSHRSWRCTFAANFNGTGLNRAEWLPQRTDTSGFTNGPTACFVDSPNNVSVSQGTLKLTARREPAPFTCRDPFGDFRTQYTGGMISTAGGRFSQTYGRFEVRARILGAGARGVQTTLWLYPERHNYGPWPASGEIDFAEMFSAFPDRVIPFVHYNSRAGDPTVTNNRCKVRNLGAFHKYAVVWTRTKIRMIFDGKTCLTHRPAPAAPLAAPAPFNQPFFIALTQGLGVHNNAFDSSATPLPATTEVDYVRAWR